MSKMNDREVMERSVSLARQCVSEQSNPLVAAIAIREGKVLETAYRGEIRADDHAEFTLIRKLGHIPLAGATVFTTLEPCTTRGKDKVSCADRLAEHKVSRVVVGMLDPNPLVSGYGIQKLRKANITVDLYPPDLMAQIEEMNRSFIRSIESDAIFQAVKQMGRLARHSRSKQQRSFIGNVILEAADRAQHIANAETEVEGFEQYLKRFLDVVTGFDGTEHVQAFIKLTSYTQPQLETPMMERFYDELERLVKKEKLVIDYLFLYPPGISSDQIPTYIQRLAKFAARLYHVEQTEREVSPELIAGNIVLFHGQKRVFLHNRDGDRRFIGATECASPEHYHHYKSLYDTIELLSKPPCHESATRSAQIDRAAATWRNK